MTTDLKVFTRGATRVRSDSAGVWLQRGVKQSGHKSFAGRSVKLPKEQVQAQNRYAVYEFKQALRKKYHGTVANWLFPNSRQLAKAGKPLQIRRVKLARSYEKAGRAIAKKQVINSTQFKAIAGKAKGGLLSRNYKSLLRALDAYHRDVIENPNKLSDTEKLKRLEKLQKQAKAFSSRKKDELLAVFDNAKSEIRVKQRILGTEALIRGLDAQRNSLLLGRDMDNSMFVPRHEIEVDENFAGGDMMSVSKITYRNGEQFVFKPAADKDLVNDGMPLNAIASGIPTDKASSNLHGREVAAARVGRLLNLDVVPKTEFAVHAGKPGSAQKLVANSVHLYKTEQIADEQELAAIGDDQLGPAEVCTELSVIDFSQPEMQKSLADAHVAHLLMGAVDPNTTNFLYQRGENSEFHARIIDNALSFGDRFTDLSPKTMDKLSGNSHVMLTKLPRLIDARTAARIEELQPEDIREALADTGLTDEEIEATVGRLQDLQQHIKKIRNGLTDGQIVETWDDSTYQQSINLKASRRDDDDNYIRRNMRYQMSQAMDSPLRVTVLESFFAQHNAQTVRDMLSFLPENELVMLLREDLQKDGKLSKILQRKCPDVLKPLGPDAQEALLKVDAKGIFLNFNFEPVD